MTSLFHDFFKKINFWRVFDIWSHCMQQEALDGQPLLLQLLLLLLFYYYLLDVLGGKTRQSKLQALKTSREAFLLLYFANPFLTTVSATAPFHLFDTEKCISQSHKASHFTWEVSKKAAPISFFLFYFHKGGFI